MLFTSEKIHVHTHAQNNKEEKERKSICLGIWNAKLVLFYALGECYNINECGGISYHLWNTGWCLWQAERGANTKGENTRPGWVCCHRGWGGHALLRAQGGALGTPGSIQTGLKVLFSLLPAKALLMKPLDFFCLVETWGRWLKRFQAFLAPENAQEGFWCAGGLCSALGVCPAAPHSWDSWDSLTPPHRDSRITLITRGFAAKVPGGSRNALCSHCFSLWFSWIHWRKGLVLKPQQCVWRPGWVCPRLKQPGNTMDDHHMAWIHW